MFGSTGKLYEKLILNRAERIGCAERIGRPGKRRAIGDAIRVPCRTEHFARGAESAA